MIGESIGLAVKKTVEAAVKEAAKEASKAALEGAKKVTEGAETVNMFGKLGNALEAEHVTLGKVNIEHGEAPVRLGSEKEEFFGSDPTMFGNQITHAVKEVKPPRHITTINEDLEGQTYPGTNVAYKRRTFTANGERLEGVFPVFESKANITLPKNLLCASDTEQFKYCTQQLAKRIENDPDFAAQFTPRQLEQIKNGEPRISGLTWHHNEVPGKMQLVDADLHNTCRHTGGRSIWGGGNDCR